MPYNHIMLDLETLSSSPKAAIVSIGAVYFDLKDRSVGEGSSWVVDLDDYNNWEDFDIDPRTVKWWLSQEREAQKTITGEGIFLTAAISQFNAFKINSSIKNGGEDPFIWGNGAGFDNVILRHAFESLAVPAWSHRKDMCFRTLKNLFPTDYIPNGVKHSALDDATNQALHLIEIVKKYDLRLL